MEDLSKFEQYLEKVKELGGSEDLINDLRAERTAKNESDKNKRKKDREILDTLKDEFKVDTKDEVVSKVKGSKTELSDLKNQIAELKQNFETEQELKKKAELKSKITSLLSEKKIKTNAIITAGLIAEVKEDDGKYSIDGCSLEDYIQKELVDNVESVIKTKTKTVKANDTDLFSADELAGDLDFSNPEVMQKVDRSIVAIEGK